MRILHLIDIPWWSGLSSYAFDCVRAHLDLGHQVSLACEKGSLPHKMAEKMELKTFPIYGRSAWFSPLNFARIGSFIQSERPDWIVAHTGSTHWIAFFWGKLLHAGVIRTRAVFRPARSDFFNRRLYSGTDWIVSASEKLKLECAESLHLEGGRNLLSIFPPAGTPSEVSFPSPQRGEGQGEGGRKKIGILARLDPCKGHSVFLRSAKIIQENFGDSEFHIAGPEENLKWHHLLNEINEFKLKNVTYHGFLPRNNVWEFMRSCHVGVISSLESEEVSRALLEWFSAGRPVVATRVGCIPGILEDGKGGYLVSPGNPQEMAEKIKEILANPSLSVRMGEFNARLAREKFSREHFREKWREILQRRGDH